MGYLGAMTSEQWHPPALLDNEFYSRPAELVAPDLLGKVLWRISSEGTVALRIVETEAYGGFNDPGSHGYRGMTSRNAAMFGESGRAYIYFTYGMHHCLNVVTEREGICSAVLIRAGEPLWGVELMALRRGRNSLRDLASGPAKLTQALSLDRGQNQVRIDGQIIGIGDGPIPSIDQIVVGPRVGIRNGLDLNWRFAIAGNPYVSRPAPSNPYHS